MPPSAPIPLALMLLPLITIIPSILAASIPFHNVRYCGTSEPEDDLLASHKYLYHHEPLDNNLWNASLLSDYHHPQSMPKSWYATPHSHAHARSRRQATNPLYTVDTYFHVVSDTNSSLSTSPCYVTDTMIANQFQYLAKAYTDASIGYHLRGIDRTTNDLWARNGDDVAMKTALRQGTYSTLNIYYQSQLQSAPGTPGVPAGSTLLGYCSLPSAGVMTTTSASTYILDGCNVLSGTMPGGTYSGYSLGGTTAHEVGHWNGLLHTFQDNSCDVGDYGDHVADTPQESTSTNGCPTSKDTCPSSGVAAGYNGVGGPSPYGPQGYSGPDPIHNFMDYSDDACYTGFTAGQGARMLNIWQIYRQGL